MSGSIWSLSRGCVIGCALFATSAAAQAPIPAEPQRAGPARVASAPVEAHDDTTPKGALKLLSAALRDGDAEQIRRVMHAANAAEVRMVSSMAEMARAMAQLQKAAVKAFGEEGAKEMVGDTLATDAEGRARIDAAEVRLTGDTATVVIPEGEDAPVVLKKVDGHWKVPMAELSRNADPTALDERLTELTEQRTLVQELTKEIGEGQFATPAQAKDAWQSRAMQSVTRRPPARKPQPDAAKQGAGATAPPGEAAARPASAP